MLAAPSQDRVLGTDPTSGLPVQVRAGRFGPYVQLGEVTDGGPRPRTASLFATMTPETLTLEQALELLSIPRVVGPDPDTGEEIVAHNGKFGPYLKRGSDTRSLDSEEQILSVDLDTARALFAQPKARRGRTPAAPLRELGADPDTGLPMMVKEGRFGPYVTDGTTNASLRKGDAPESLTVERAAELLAERRAAGPSTRKRAGGAKKATAKKATAKKATAKKATAKKATAKKATAKKAAAKKGGQEGGKEGSVSSSQRGRLVALEGIDGCGKTTQARLLATALGAVLTFEPGATELGRCLRNVLLDPAGRAPVGTGGGAVDGGGPGPARARGGRAGARCRAVGRDRQVLGVDSRIPGLREGDGAGPSAGRRALRCRRCRCGPQRPGGRRPGSGTSTSRRGGSRPPRATRPGLPRSGPTGIPPSRRRRSDPVGGGGRDTQHRVGRGGGARRRVRSARPIGDGDAVSASERPVPELFDEIVDQPTAVRQLRAAARMPVHAYLFHGPGPTTRTAARAFAAALLCPFGGCGQCEHCRQALAGIHPDFVVVERTGASLSVEDARRLVGLSQRRPLEASRQVLVVADVHLAVRSAPALLKTVEEPPASTVFVLLAEHLPPELTTLVSRSVVVRFPPVPAASVARWLEAKGVEPRLAALVAEGSGGDPDRARLLAEDPGYSARHELWRSVPARLDGTGTVSGELARELLAAADSVVEPLRARHARELAALAEEAKAVGERAASGRKDLADRQAREERRWRTDELRAGLGVLARAYRDRLIDASGSSSALGVAEGRASGAAVDLITEAARSLQRNPSETLLLEALFVRLAIAGP